MESSQPPFPFDQQSLVALYFLSPQFVSASFVATVQIGLRDVDGAFASLEQAAREHSYYVPWCKIDPDLDPLRSDPRFTALLKKAGLE